MLGSKNPWEIHPALTPERLAFIAALIRDVRAEVITLHEPHRGDNGWSLGCRAYVRICHEIVAASTTDEHREWLSIVEQVGLHFVFGIGGVPVRFYRSDAEDEVPERTLRRNYPELDAQQCAFEFMDDPSKDLICRIAVETDETGLVSRIVFLQVDSTGATHNLWNIPLGGATVIPFTTRREGVALPPPRVSGVPNSTRVEAERSGQKA